MPHLPADFALDTYETWFRTFTQEFLRGSELDRAHIQLKIDHTWRVLDFARRITGALAPVPEMAALAHLAALCHDVGRFPQYALYHTFHDRLSVNHASQGVITLKEHRVLSALAPEARKLVLGAVALHNRRFLPPHLPPDVQWLTQIVRDADKLDIFAVMLDHFDPGQPSNQVVSMELKPHPENYTPAIFHRVSHRQVVNYQDMVWVNDFKLMLCSWVYDLNFPVSREVVRERGYVTHLLQYLPRTPDFDLLGRQLQEAMEM